MKNFTKELLIKFNHAKPREPCHSRHAKKIPTHGAKVQCADIPDESPLLNKEDAKRIQAIVGSLFHCKRAVDNELLVTLSAISMKTHSPATFTLKNSIIY